MKLRHFLIPLLTAAILVLPACEEEHVHQYASEITSPASCTEDGVKTFTCACGDTYTEAVPAPGVHSFDGGTVTKDPTCADEGMKTVACTVCGEKKEETVAATGAHAFGDAVIGKAPTCGADGEVTMTCSVCGEKVHSAVEKTGAHAFGENFFSKEPTCGTDGEIAASCTVCGYTKTAPYPKTGNHSFDAGTVTKPATCGASGVKTLHCTVCGLAKPEQIPLTAKHTWESVSVITAATCGGIGSENVHCTVCGMDGKMAIPPTGKHSFDAGKITRAATCSAEGLLMRTCTVCGGTRGETIAKTADHSWNGGVTTREATCARDGVTTYTCTLCRTTKTEAIPKTENHSWETRVKKQPTATEEGFEAEICRFCGKLGAERTVPPYAYDGAKEKDPTHIRTSYRVDSSVDLVLSGNRLTVSGYLRKEGLTQLHMLIGQDVPGDKGNTVSYSWYIPLTSGTYFTMTLSLNHITDGMTKPIEIMTVADGDQYADRFRVAAVTNENGNYRFVQSPVLDHNIRMLQTPMDPEKYVGDVADNIKKLSDEIVGRETDDMKKAYLLYKWVSENVYSDTSTSATTNAATAMATRRGTSSAYTSLLIDLCRAQGIPAMRVGIFRSDKNAAGVMSDTDANTTTPNYNCVEAYIESEDRWIIMDPTAASKNKMISGAKTDYPIEDYYFDISLYTFSLNSKILERPRSW